jgi:hypothetical protein
VSDLHRLREQHARGLEITLPDNPPAAFDARLQEALAAWRPGACDIIARHPRWPEGMVFAPEWRVRPARELVERLESLTGRTVWPRFAPVAADQRLADQGVRP